MAALSRLRKACSGNAPAACLTLSLALCLAGCGESSSTQSSLNIISRLALSGHVLGGQQPIQSAQTPALRCRQRRQRLRLHAHPHCSGLHRLRRLLHPHQQLPCASTAEPLYIVATGGNATSATGSNAALALMAVLGPCGQLSSSTPIVLNELTTVAAAWALAPFITSATNVGASATNAHGIANAFLNAQLLATTATGKAPTLPANLSVESAKLYALANALHPCVVSASANACSTLFAAATSPTGLAPQNHPQRRAQHRQASWQTMSRPSSISSPPARHFPPPSRTRPTTGP